MLMQWRTEKRFIAERSNADHLNKINGSINSVGLNKKENLFP